MLTLIMIKAPHGTARKWYSLLKNRLRVILMKAAYWTAIGAMAIPLGVSILAIAISFGGDLSPFWAWVALVAIIAGFASFIAGWVYTIREEHQKHKEYELRIKREKASLKALVFMADQLGVDMSDEVDMEDIE